MDEKLQIIISAQVADLQKGCEEAKKQVATIGKETQTQSDKMAKAFSNIGKAIIAAFSVNAIKNFLGECSAAYNESVQNEAKLTEIMKTRIGASDEQIESVTALATAQQKLGVVEDDTAIAGAQQLATFATNTDTINKLVSKTVTQNVRTTPVFDIKKDNMTINVPLTTTGRITCGENIIAAGNIGTTNGFIASTKNGNTVTIGSQNTGLCHFMNSAGIPFYFNKDVLINGNIYPYSTTPYSCGTSANPWTNTYTKALTLNGSGVNDFIVSNTNSGIWHILKYNSGIAIMYGAKAYSGINITKAWGNAYESTVGFQESYPITFGYFYSSVSIRDSSCGLQLENSGEASSTKTQLVYLTRPGNSASGATVTLNFLAIGVWK